VQSYSLSKDEVNSLAVNAKGSLLAAADDAGEVQVIEIARPRYVGARIGIHNPKGEKVGAVGRLRNVEYLFVVSQRPVRLADAA
jgi:adenine-specific DNA-methyltransferase